MSGVFLCGRPWLQLIRLLRFGITASKKHLLVFCLLHSFAYKLLSQRRFISGYYNIESAGGKWAQWLSELRGEFRRQRATVKLSARLVPIGGRWCIVRLNFGDLPGAALHEFSVWNPQSMGTNDNFTGQSDVRIHAYQYMRSAAPQAEGSGGSGRTCETRRALYRGKFKPISSFWGLP